MTETGGEKAGQYEGNSIADRRKNKKTSSHGMAEFQFLFDDGE
jgi:hypothetical protein